MHHDNVYNKRCFALEISLKSVSEILLPQNGVFRRQVQNVFTLVTVKGCDLGFLQKIYDVIPAIRLLLESRCYYLCQTKLG